MTIAANQTKNALPAPDSPLRNHLVAEVVGFHLHHSAGNQEVPNGFTFEVRQGDQRFSVSVTGAENQEEESNKTPFSYLETGGERYHALISGNNELLDNAQKQVIAFAPSVLEILNKLKG